MSSSELKVTPCDSNGVVPWSFYVAQLCHPNCGSRCLCDRAAGVGGGSSGTWGSHQILHTGSYCLKRIGVYRPPVGTCLRVCIAGTAQCQPLCLFFLKMRKFQSSYVNLEPVLTQRGSPGINSGRYSEEVHATITLGWHVLLSDRYSEEAHATITPGWHVLLSDRRSTGHFLRDVCR